MAYSFIIRDKAIKEFTDAVIWYEDQQDGLGKLFRAEFNKKLNQVCNNPYHYKISHKKFHVVLVGTFPFLITYGINENENLIIVVAVFIQAEIPKRN